MCRINSLSRMSAVWLRLLGVAAGFSATSFAPLEFGISVSYYHPSLLTAYAQEVLSSAGRSSGEHSGPGLNPKKWFQTPRQLERLKGLIGVDGLQAVWPETTGYLHVCLPAQPPPGAVTYLKSGAK